MAIRLFTLCLMLLYAAQALAAGGAVVGQVTSSDGDALAGVTVLLQGTSRGAVSDVDGRFRIQSVPAGTYTVVFSMVGYQRETRPNTVVTEGRETVVNVVMTQAPIQTEQVVVTANKREQSLQEVPVSISILEAAEIQQRNSLTIEDALRYVPGVNITGGQANIRGSSGYSRGAGSRVLMLLDGIPFIAGDTGELNFESIPIGQVDRIEVVKGASSALYGSNALGGVINVITKAIPEKPETDVRAYGGMYNKPSYKQWQWSGKNRWFNGESFSHARKTGDLGVALFFSRQIDDGYRLNDYRRRYNLYLKTTEDFENAGSLMLNLGLLYQYGGQFLYWRSLDSALIPPVLQQNDNVKSMRYYVAGTYNGVIRDTWHYTVRANWYHNDWGYETIRAIGRTESMSDILNVDALSVLSVGDKHTVTFGMQGDFDMVSADLFGFRRGGGFALYGQDELKLSDLFTLTLGARYDFNAGFIHAAGQVNPKAAVTFTPGMGTTLRASFGRGFRIPSVAETFLSGEVSNLAAVPNRDLKPERSFSYEVGASQVFGNWGVFDVAGFWSDFYNLIEAGLTASAEGFPQIQWRNVTRARVQGVESSFRLGLFKGALTSSVGYTYVYPRDITHRSILKYRPRHLFYANLTGRVGWLMAGADFRYVSRVEQIDFELVNLGIIPDGDARTNNIVTDVRLGADLSDIGIPASATLNVNNLFQRNYVELIGNMMPPRTYMLVLEMHP